MMVTGGAQGLGAAIAAGAAAAGYRVAVFDQQEPDTGADVEFFAGSVTDGDAITAALDAFGAPDVLVNNAGIVRFGPLLDLDAADFRSVIDVNLIGGFQMAQAVVNRLLAEGRTGAVINITSMNGVAAGPNAGAYAASKAGLAMLTSQMALEWGPLGIRVNAVAPGLIDGGMSAPIYADPQTRQARESKVPLGRLGQTDDVTQAVLFLASDEASYITGQNLLVDGGVTGSVIAHLPRPASVEAGDQT